jgi:hypothetical protein
MHASLGKAQTTIPSIVVNVKHVFKILLISLVEALIMEKLEAKR